MFLQNATCNMSNSESYLRFTTASVILMASVAYGYFWLAIISIVLFHSALTKHCFFYSLLKINERFNLNSYYITQLPKYNRSASFIFDSNGKKLFENRIAKSEFKHIQSVDDLNITNMKELINKSANEESIYINDSKTYQIYLQGVKEDQLLLIYIHDVTKVIELNDAIEETQREVIYAMGEIGETRSRETGYHVKRVALYSEKLALLYGLSQEEAALIKMASPMHDIGKVAIADEILNAPRRLTKEEFEIMKTHAQLGFDMLKMSNKPILKAAATVALEHHEKYDGTGYPNGLAGEDIHIYGRITAVADVFDALGSDRIYKKAWELEKILEFFDQESGKHFDPKLIELFKDNLDDFLLIRDTYHD